MVHATYFDGRSTVMRQVELSIVDDDLIIAGDNIDVRVPFREVRVDERLGDAPRRLRLQHGAFCEVRDLRALDGLLALASHRDGWVEGMQRRSTSVLLAIVGSIVLIVVAYRWGLPWAAAAAAHRLPTAVGKTIAVQAMKVLDGGTLQPSHISNEQQQRLTEQFHALRLPEGGTAHSALLFRASRQLGANAFTLPDGTIVVLDDLIKSMGDDQHVMAVLSHELGHAYGLHSLQLLLQGSVVAAFWTLYVGDISHLAAAAPAALVQARYSQNFERQADDYGAELLVRNGMSPNLLAEALDRLSKNRPEAAAGGYLFSHPPTAERIRHLRMLAGSKS
jgi:Zn-dependent protease with chaperone function